MLYRIKATSLDLLSPRERVDNILPVGFHFLERSGRRLKLNPDKLTPDAKRVLLDYSRSGNSRVFLEINDAIFR